METDVFTELESASIGHERPLASILDALKFNDAGLIPAIAQDAETREVLMLAWMNRQAIERTLAEGYACYWSRSRRQFWRKGETSGNLQALREMRIDCDGDAILLLVDQRGPACHTLRTNCFFLLVDGERVRVTSNPG